MLLDRIDIDSHGPLTRVEIGPLAEHMNVICGPEGSGKTAITRFIRDSLVDRRYPLGMMSSSTGRVVWADRNGMIHCRREQDGTAEGRRTIEFESRGDQYHSDPYNRDRSLEHSWLAASIDDRAASRAAGCIQLPESIVDCVITDTAVTNVARVVSACIRNGLDSPQTYRSLPIAEDRSYSDREDSARDSTAGVQQPDRHRALRAQLADIEAELARIESSGDYDALIARREELTSRLAVRPEGFVRHAGADDDRRRKLDIYLERAEQLRRRQNQLRRWIAELDAELNRVRTSYHAPFQLGDRSYCDYRETVYRTQATQVDDHLRRRLDDLDTQMIRWRRMLMEVRGLRETLYREHDQPVGQRTTIDNIARRQRLDDFLHMIDRYDRERPSRDALWTQYDNDSAYYHCTSDEIESRIDAATRQIDWLLQRYLDGGLYFEWYQSAELSPNYRSATTLSETLQAIRHDLHQVAGATRRQHQQHRQIQRGLAAEVARSQSDRRPDRVSELGELHRSEQWLVSAIGQLSQHRESLLRHFATNSIAPSDSLGGSLGDSSRPVGNWDIHLWDAAGYAKERAQRVSELDHVTAQLNTCVDQVADLRRGFRGDVRRDFRRAVDHQPKYFDEFNHGTVGHEWIDDDAIRNELSRIDESLASHWRAQSLRARRAELRNQLQVVRHGSPHRSPLAEDASRWLVRLSGGRLRRIEWNTAAMQEGSGKKYRRSSHAEDANGAKLPMESGVRIDSRDEVNCPAADRALGSLAVRLAAGDLLARTGRTVPLVIETWRELLVDTVSPPGGNAFHASPYSLRGFDHQYHGTPLAFYHDGDAHDHIHPIASALYDYSRSGRQVVVLTSDISLTDQIERAGGRRFDLVGQYAVHPHRPLWRSHYKPESYSGPHPHVYGYETETSERFAGPRSSYDVDVNRSFDVAWREAYGIDDNPDSFVARSPRASVGRGKADRAQTDWAVDGVEYRDGYYYTDTYTTVPRAQRGDSPRTVFQGVTPTTSQAAADHAFRKPESSFFLTVDSPIDQAPSIDAIAAARLRGLSITHINHLMQQDPNRLSDALGLANVNAAAVRRWQSECRLVCRVPQLRGFDARILVGCGITQPGQLAAIAPVDLLDRVKDFLATEWGQRILLSGSSYELSRITSWIAAANPSSGINGRGSSERVGFRKFTSRNEGRRPNDLERDDFDKERYEYKYPISDDGANRYRGRRHRIRTVGEIDRDLNELDADETAYSTRDGVSDRDRSSGQAGRGRGAREPRTYRHADSEAGRQRSAREIVRLAEERTADAYRDIESDDEDDSLRESAVEYNERGSSTPAEGSKRRGSRGNSEARRSRKKRSRSRADRPDSAQSRAGRTVHTQSASHESELRFYLQRDSDIVDAPSIGARMAERLNTVGIDTVNDLLQADAEQLAIELDDQRVDAETIVAWQHQAAMVCRVPMLRGHDAQLLVAADVTTPEELVTYSAEDLFALIDPISHSREGKRILRGGILPDLNEIAEWLHYAQHQRELMAA